jgi:hypothetical protein
MGSSSGLVPLRARSWPDPKGKYDFVGQGWPHRPRGCARHQVGFPERDYATRRSLPRRVKVLRNRARGRRRAPTDGCGSSLPTDVPKDRRPTRGQHAGEVGAEGCRIKVDAEGIARHVDEGLCLHLGCELLLRGQVGCFEPNTTVSPR